MGLPCGTVITLKKGGRKMVNNTFCLNCGVISKGTECNNCGETNIAPAHDYNEDGFTICPNCGQAFRYKVGKCSVCQSGDKPESEFVDYINDV